MKDTDIIEYLATKDLVSALWWFIENQGMCGSPVFFHLRERVRLWQLAEGEG